jgi:hypothetical protein
VNRFLFVGGPAHGREFPVPDENMAFVYVDMARVDASNDMPDLVRDGGAGQVMYYRRTLGSHDQQTGEAYIRMVYVVCDMIGADINAMVTHAVMAAWYRGGRKVER